MINPYQSKWIKAAGELVKTEHGVKIDFSSAIFTSNLGHNNTRIKQAVIEQLKNGFTNTYRHPTDIKAKYLLELHRFFGSKAAYLYSTGAEACEAAVRIARFKYPGLLSMMKEGFHGKTRGVANYRGRLGVVGYTDQIKRANRGTLIIEPYRPYDAAWYDPLWLMALCKEYPCIICDEVQSGFFRCGSKLAHYQYDDFEPKIVVIGKGIANGFPLAAVLIFDDALASAAHAHRDELSSTYAGNPLACAAGLAALEQYRFFEEPEGYRHLRRLSDLFATDFPAHNGRGLCRALYPRPQLESTFVNRCFAKGVIVIPTGKGWVKLAPPLTIREGYFRKGLKIISEVYYDLQRA